MDHSHPEPQRQVTRARWVWIGFALVALFFLWTEHRAHLLGVLPYLLVLACPLMHLFMHHGHGHSHQGQQNMSQPGGASPDHRTGEMP